MSSRSNKSRPLFWFYLLVAYVLLQFIWWGYLMMDLNNEIVILKTELNLLKGESPEEIITLGNELNQKLHKRFLMIVGEGLVFISLLIIGIFQVRKTYIKESKLAQQQQNFLLSVTHELKSPIASAKLQLQTLQKHSLEKEKQQELIGNALADTERLNTLVENILLAAKIENNNSAAAKSNTNISDLCNALLSQNLNSFKHKHNIVNKIEPGIFLDIDTSTFPSIFINLFENAIKYSPTDTSITLVLKKTKEGVCLSVADEGAGVPDEEKEQIVKKFYRIGNEETRKTKGTGLGLYIVNYLAKQHNGTLIIKDNTPKGSIFEINFIS